MKPRDWLVVVICGFFLLLVQVIGTIIGPIGTVIAACMLLFVNRALLKLFDVAVGRWWLQLLSPALAMIAGILLVKASRGLSSGLLAGPVAFAISALVFSRSFTARQRCALCNTRVNSRELGFRCPRCGLMVCEKTCWSFEALRCRLCQQNRVPIFSADGRWWDQHFGRSSKHGRCQLCLSASDQVDLRLCGRCGRPYCRACWDHQNGQCGRCGWYAPDLPESLRAYLFPMEEENRNA